MVFLLGILHKPLVKNKHNYLSYYYLSRFYICCYHAINNKSKSSFPSGTGVKNPPANAWDARDMGLIPGSGRFPGEGNGNPLQYSCLENSMHRGAWRPTVHEVTKSQIWLSYHTNTRGNSICRGSLCFDNQTRICKKKACVKLAH